MKVLKKIFGVILILAGGAITLLGTGIVIVGCGNMVEWGISSVDIIMETIMIAVTLAGAGVMYGGIRLFRGKRKKVKAEEPVREAVMEEEPVRKAAMERYTLLVEDVFSIYKEGCVVTGILKGGTLALRDKLWLLKADGTKLSVTADRMEAYTQERAGKVIGAEGNTQIGIMMKEVEEQNVSLGDVVTNIIPNIDDVNSPVENPRLKGLLAGRYDTDLDNIGELIRTEIVEKARFLVLVVLDSLPTDNRDGTATFEQKSTMHFPYLTSQEDENFQPVFTDWLELKRWDPENETGFQTIVMGVDDVFAIVGNNDGLRGIVVNPFTDNLMLGEELIAEWKKAK